MTPDFADETAEMERRLGRDEIQAAQWEAWEETALRYGDEGDVPKPVAWRAYHAALVRRMAMPPVVINWEAYIE